MIYLKLNLDNIDVYIYKHTPLFLVSGHRALFLVQETIQELLCKHIYVYIYTKIYIYIYIYMYFLYMYFIYIYILDTLNNINPAI